VVDVDHKGSDLVSELRGAINEACGRSERVIAAILALQNAGQGVRIEIDTALLNAEVPAARSPAREAQTDSGGVLMLDANDLLYLRDLKISVEIGVASSE
jgi:hypothetical protein